MKKHINKGLVALGVAAALVLSGCTTAAPEADDSTTTLRLGISIDVASYADYTAATLLTRKQAVYDFLMRIDAETSQVEPWLVTEWEYSEGNTVLSMTVREDVSFTDGTPVNAEAIVANIQNRIDVKDASFNPTNIASVEATDEYSVEVQYLQPDHMALRAMAGTPIASLASIADPETWATAPITSGPYIQDLANTIDGTKWSYVRNPDYWNPEAFPFDTLEVLFFADITARVNALLSGQVDFAPIDGATFPRVVNEGFETLIGGSSSAVLMVSDRAGAIVPALADTRVRQALTLAIDREAINSNITFGVGDSSDQYFLEGNPYFVPNAGLYDYDPDQARALLAEAGYPDGVDLGTVIGRASDAPYAPALVQYLKDIGVTVEFEELPNADYAAKLQSDAASLAIRGDLYINTVANMVRPAGIWNGTRFSTPEVEELLQRIDAGTPDEAAAAQAELGQYIYDEAWFPQLAHPAEFFGLSPAVTAKLPTDYARFGPWLWDFGIAVTE